VQPRCADGNPDTRGACPVAKPESSNPGFWNPGGLFKEYFQLEPAGITVWVIGAVCTRVVPKGTGGAGEDDPFRIFPSAAVKVAVTTMLPNTVGTWLIENEPSAAVIEERPPNVETVAPATGRPCKSVTVPLSEEEPLCANEMLDINSTRERTLRNRNILLNEGLTVFIAILRRVKLQMLGVNRRDTEFQTLNGSVRPARI